MAIRSNLCRNKLICLSFVDICEDVQYVFVLLLHSSAAQFYILVNKRHSVQTAAVEACVLHGLKRRAAGFLRSNKIAALFMKVGKSFPPAEELCRKAQELEQLMETK